jgi:hypothetical protein
MFGLSRASRFAAAFFMFAHIATPSHANAVPTAPVAGSTPTSTIAAPSTGTPAPVAQMWIGYPPSTPMSAIAKPGAPLQRGPLDEMVAAFVDTGNYDAQQLCLAKAVYFEARGESLEGQLAVAEVVLNRANSGRYPSTICNVVTQPAQFSFIRRGRFPAVDTNCEAWRKALAIAEIANKGLADAVASNVLWYHASYVSPSWGRRLTRVARIGAHIFYA